MKEKRLSQFTKYCLDFMFYTGILVTITVPVLFRFLGRYFPNIEGENYVPMCVIFMVCGVLAIWIIWRERVYLILHRQYVPDILVFREQTAMESMQDLIHRNVGVMNCIIRHWNSYSGNNET